MKVENVSLELVDPDLDQPRQSYEPDEIERLASSMRDLGQLQPAIVYRVGDRFRLIDGHRRYRAAMLLGVRHFKAIVLDAHPDADKLLMTQLASNCLRVDLTPMEKAKAFQRLKDSRGWSNAELVTALHVSKATVTQCLALLSLPEEVQAQVDAGQIAGSTAYAIARAKDEGTRQSMLAAARDGNLSRDAACRTVRGRQRGEGRGSKITCRLPQAVVTITSDKQLLLKDLIGLWRAMLRESRRAAGQGFDVGTFERVLADRSRATAVGQ
jgi:ParB family chromosome partitioning protein